MADSEAGAVEPRRGLLRRWIKRLGCAGLSLLLALVVGVVALEWYLRTNPNPFLGAPGGLHGFFEVRDSRTHWLKPGVVGEQRIDGRATSVVVNSLGMRGDEIGPKQPGETRVLVLGDSFVFGHGVDQDETIPARLQQRLAETLGSRVIVGNCGVSGYGTRNLPLALERYRSLRPDAIVACTYLGNDFDDDCRLTSAVVEGFLIHGQMARAAHESTRMRWTLKYRTLFLLERQLIRFAPSWAMSAENFAATPEEIAAEEYFPPREQRMACLFFDRRADDELVKKVEERCRANYRELDTVADGIPVLHVLIPSWWHLREVEWSKTLTGLGFEPADHEFGRSQQRLLGIADELGLRMVDLTPRLAAAEDALWLKTDRHLAPAGCDRFAQWIVPALRELLGK